jgi:hypothetical protein
MEIKTEEIKNFIKTIKTGNNKIYSLKNINFWLQMIVFACVLLILNILLYAFVQYFSL